MKRNLKGDLHLLYGVFAVLALFCSIAKADFLVTWLLLLIFGIPLSLGLYTVLHEQFHAQTRLGSLAPRDIGLIFSASVGFSFQIYTSHHRNHHQHGDGPKDFSTTRTSDGAHIVLAKYLKVHALRPFVLQLVPFFSVMTMQKKNHSLFTFIDEGIRVGLRCLAFLLAGFSGLVFLLSFQLIAITTIMTLNYYQHQGIEAGRGQTWKSLWFNRIFLNLGLHDRHHAEPSQAWYELETTL